MYPKSDREALLAKYAPSTVPSVGIDTLVRFRATRNKGETLEDLYRELAAKEFQTREGPFSNKNAQEIERMMVQNRRLIEQHKNPRR